MRARRFWPAFVVAVIALGIATLAAAGVLRDGGSAPANADKPGPVSASLPGTAHAAVDRSTRPKVNSFYIPANQMDDWQAAASDRERPLIEDGVLTFDEYETAVLTTVACFEQAGVEVVHFPGYGRGGIGEPGPRLSSRGVYSYAGAIRGTPDKPPTEAAAHTAECKSGSAQVEFMWAQHTAPSEPEMQAMRDHMANCLRQAGATLPEEHPSDAELKQAKSNGASEENYWKCQFAAADAFEIDELPG